jgi:putative radical SAM enzyme (TIGR03279 family)
MTGPGVKVCEVEPGSLADSNGLRPGDEIVAVDGHAVPDELALKFWLARECVELEVKAADGSVRQFEIDLSEGRSLGIKVDDFRTRTCNNACLFCFIDQLPPGIRPTLKIKDDDYRLSFLHGNYITLTNLPERELDRIIEQALSPLYVSVHATDPELRARLLGRRKTDDLDRKLRKLIAGGTTIHAQIVLMPEINDGSHLEKTLSDLYAYYPGVNSVAIVPLGLSDHGKPRQLYKPVTPPYCRDLIGRLAPWQTRFRREIRSTFAYLADEFYIQGGVLLPDAGYYDEFAQIEDGVGMVRRFLDDFAAELPRWRKHRPELNGTLATARLFYPFLKGCIERFNVRLGARLQVREIPNQFMGRDITVAGLLAGRDFVDALAGTEFGDFVVIPGEAVSRLDGILVDDMSPEQLGRRLGKPVYAGARTVSELFDLLCRQANAG